MLPFMSLMADLRYWDAAKFFKVQEPYPFQRDALKLSYCPVLNVVSDAVRPAKVNYNFSLLIVELPMCGERRYFLIVIRPTKDNLVDERNSV